MTAPTWEWKDKSVGLQPITQTYIPSATDQWARGGTAYPRHPIGMTAKAVSLDTASSLIMEGEFIYLKGVASTVAGSIVTYNPYTGVTALAVANAIGPIAVAMSANLATGYGWYQIKGVAHVKTVASVAAGTPGYLCATAGSLDDAVVVGDEIYNSLTLTATDTPTTGFSLLGINYSFVTNASN